MKHYTITEEELYEWFINQLRSELLDNQKFAAWQASFTAEGLQVIEEGYNNIAKPILLIQFIKENR